MDCPHLPEWTADAFWKRLMDRAYAQRIPIAGSIELTARCNLKCVHCYICGASDGGIELTLSELKRLIDQIVDEGCLWLLVTGGEPLIRGDFPNFYSYARRKGLLVSVFTNGTLLTETMAAKLAELTPSSVEITLYGRTERTYEAVTGVPGSYRRCIRGIELALDLGLPVGLKTMVLSLNKHELWDMKAYAEQLGVSFRFDSSVNARLDGGREPVKYRIPPEEVVELDVVDQKRARLMAEFAEKYRGKARMPAMLYQCGGGVNSFHVDAYGRLSICMMSRTPAWELRYGLFSEAWADFIPSLTQKERRRITPCVECELNALCEQCPGWGMTESGDPETPVEYLCRIAHLRDQYLQQTGGVCSQ
jgi:radical SAM protein with 4Fe4S-binding SPASM domain